MFDFSFGEIFVIAVVAVIFLGPDKLPQTFVKIAKFLRAIKKTINDAKDTLDREIHISEMKQDALEYKKKFADSAEKLKNEILKDADVEGIKREIEGAKSAAILNESLEKSSISFDEVESKGKAVQERLKGNLKKKNASGNSSLGTPCGDFGDLGRFADSSPVSHPKSPKNSTTSTANTRICDLDSANQVKNAESTLDSAESQNLRENQAKVAESTKKSKKSTLDSANKKPKKSPRNTTKNRRTKQDGSN